MMHTMYLAKVRAPGDTDDADDVSEVIREIPAEEAFMPLAKSTCALVKK